MSIAELHKLKENMDHRKRWARRRRVVDERGIAKRPAVKSAGRSLTTEQETSPND